MMVANKNSKFLSGKKLVFLVFFFTSVITASFGQIRWTTVQDNNYRVIPMTQVKSEILGLADLYQWFYEPQIFTRDQYKFMMELGLRNSDALSRRDYERTISWLNNHQRFVICSHIPELNGINIEIINGNSVGNIIIANDNPVGIGISTRNKQRLGQIIDSLLR